jgi:hypothetical protein
MTGSGPYPAGDDRRPAGRWAVIAVVVLVAAGWVAIGVHYRDRTSAPAAAPALRPAAAGTPPARSRSGPSSMPTRPVAAVARSVPVRLRIPALGLTVGVSELGLNPDRTVQVPTDFQLPGWFRLGPTPGQVGSAVILGHVDSYRGPAVFFRLRSLRVADRIEVSLADGTVARFAVRAVATYLKRDFPARQVYGSHGDRALQLVTCGGAFDHVARSYLSNIVVYTSLVAVIPPAAGASAVR